MTTPDTLTSGHQECDVWSTATCDAVTLLQLLRISSSPQLVKMIISVIMMMMIMMMVMMVRGPQTVWKCWQWGRAEPGWRWRGEVSTQDVSVREVTFGKLNFWLHLGFCLHSVQYISTSGPRLHQPRRHVSSCEGHFGNFDLITLRILATTASVPGRASNEGYLKVFEDFTIMEKAHTRVFTFKTLLRHYAKWT